MEPERAPASDPSITTPIGMCCQQCRRNGDDVRLVNYPFLLSLFTFQFRFELRGRWCERHRNLRLLLAGFLSATLGWLGFPFCLVATPRTLFGLASGIGIHKGNNARLLRGLAEMREAQGDLEGAIHCMEGSFQYLDDLWGRQELRRMYALRGRPDPAEQTVLRQILAPLGVLLVALLLGNLIGLADFYLLHLLKSIRFPLLDVLLGWLVLSGLGIPAALLVRAMVKNILTLLHRPTRAFSLAFGLTAGLLLVTGVVAGRGLGNFVLEMWNNPTRLPGVELLTAMAAGLTRGWWLELYRFTHQPLDLAHLIYLVFLLVYALFAGAAGAWEIARWKGRLAEVAEEAPAGRALEPGWLAPVLLVAAILLATAAVPQQSRLDFVEARDAYNRGLELEYAERYDEATAWFERAIQLDEHMAEAYEELAWVYYQKGDALRAISQSLRSIEVNPNRASVHYYLGNIYYFEEDNEKAYHEFERAIVLNPGYYDAYIGSGWAAYALGDLTKAELSFLKALEHSPKPYDAYIGLGKIYEDRGKTTQAIETYQRANQTDVTSATADVYLGLAYLKRNELDKAIQYLENAVIKDQSNRMARTYLLMSYINAGRFEDAVRTGSDAVDRFPNRAGLHALLATAYTGTGEELAAREQLDLAVAAADKSDLDYVLIIHTLLRQGQYSDAEAAARQALVESPDRGDFYLDLSSALMNQKKYEQALDAVDRAGLAGINPVEILLKRAQVYLAWGKLDLSLELLQEASQLDNLNATVHTLLGQVYYQQGKLEEALLETRQALLLDGYNLDGYINLGFVLLETGDGAEAVKAASQAVRLSPNLDVPHFILGMGYFNTGQDTNALTELNRYLQLSKNSNGAENMRAQAQKALQSLNKVY